MEKDKKAPTVLKEVEMPHMAADKAIHQKMSDGSLKAIVITGQKDMTPITIDGIEYDIGIQEEHRIVQNIKPEAIGIMYRYLREQLSTQEALVKPHKDYFEQHKDIDAEGKVADLLKEIKNDKKFKEWPKLDKYADIAVKKVESKKVIDTYMKSINIIIAQLKFFEENFKL
jgi:hypothetical protein